MTLPQSALSELLEAIRAGGDLDVVREAMRLVAQELIELEASQAIGEGRYERTEERTTHRNGSRTRLLSTKAGDRPGPPGVRCTARSRDLPRGSIRWRPPRASRCAVDRTIDALATPPIRDRAPSAPGCAVHRAIARGVARSGLAGHRRAAFARRL